VVVDIIEVVAGDQSGTAGGDADASAVVVDVIINDRSVAAIGIDADQVAVDRRVIVDDRRAGVGAVQQDAGPAGGRDVRVAGDGRGDVHETCGGVEVDADLIGGDVQAADGDVYCLGGAGPEAVGIAVELPDAAGHIEGRI